MRPVRSPDGGPDDWERGPELEHQETYELCRCGRTATEPFCDGSEQDGGFDGTETADRRLTRERRRTFGDPGALSDDRSFCSRAGFCVRGDVDAWELAVETGGAGGAGDEGDPGRRALLHAMAARCPSGRLVAVDGTDGSAVEPALVAEIGVIDDGPLWVRGGIPVEGGDGTFYEVRNRVTLCRCGRSANKPFCDGSHLTAAIRLSPTPPQNVGPGTTG